MWWVLLGVSCVGGSVCPALPAVPSPLTAVRPELAGSFHWCCSWTPRSIPPLLSPPVTRTAAVLAQVPG